MTPIQWRLRGILLCIAGAVIIVVLVVPPRVPLWLRYTDVAIAALIVLTALLPRGASHD